MIGLTVFEVAYYDEYHDFDEFSKGMWSKKYFTFPIMLGLTIVLIPLCLIKDISKMRFASLFSIISLIYAIFVIVIQSPSYFSSFTEEERKQINWFNFGKAWDSNLYFFQGAACIFFAYTCHAGAFPVYKTLKNSVSRRINKVFLRSISLDFVIYLATGVCGFLTAPVHAPELIIYRDKKNKTDNDLAMTIARVALCFNLILSIPANYNAFRISFFEIVWKTSEISNKR